MNRSTARRSAAALLAASLVALGATACNTGGSSVSTEAKKPASGAPASPGGAKPAAAAPAKVGDTIALKGFEKSSTADVTVVKVVDNAEGEDEFSKPADGKRFVAVQFRIKATGKAYSDAPANSAKLLDAQGQSFTTSLYDTKAGQGFSGSVNIAPGESGLGFLTFEVPKGVVLDKVQFTLDSGMADQTGQWKLA
ncbi:DUF4352 domain-containing protein [Kitasatospora sp. DSM 101779]|uniref:DUF4352 domain-containing protein n=1 Tax=Kitasatospora sp. DSM 101779 TaxID=2853165 RepID=UPI0021D9C541|nr:DUF4352 domain-containing protein [Kitasatospora sp. DSM 101779]MCU7823127.1 DUF4352 domain-containing protein [Kitasatospora sp. DSM 101779]